MQDSSDFLAVDCPIFPCKRRVGIMVVVVVDLAAWTVVVVGSDEKQVEHDAPLPFEDSRAL